MCPLQVHTHEVDLLSRAWQVFFNTPLSIVQSMSLYFCWFAQHRQARVVSSRRGVRIFLKNSLPIFLESSSPVSFSLGIPDILCRCCIRCPGRLVDIHLSLLLNLLDFHELASTHMILFLLLHLVVVPFVADAERLIPSAVCVNFCL